ncbi:hypothetical protein HPB50_012477 [Hyalomma asiaticum]|uniref:Uncharacterized protein n=1 Tax=Hyalomma asiaticum TaxID=266040 RepID=A0ACB7TFE9_HYAAI|nr:hypothetical protein HPB50_012477 [Hyalomma asiaticum]
MSYHASSSKVEDVLDLHIGSDDDDFLGDVKASTASAPVLPLQTPTGACASSSLGVTPKPVPIPQPSHNYNPGVVASHNCNTGVVSPSSLERQAAGGGPDGQDFLDLRDRMKRTGRPRRRKPKRRRRWESTDLRALLSEDKARDTEDAYGERGTSTARDPISERRAPFLGDGRVRKTGHRNFPRGISRRPRTYVDLDRPVEDAGDDYDVPGLCLQVSTAEQDIFIQYAENTVSAEDELEEGQWDPEVKDHT